MIKQFYFKCKSNGNEGVLHILQISRTGASPLYGLVSYLWYSLEGTPLQKCCRGILQLQPPKLLFLFKEVKLLVLTHMIYGFIRWPLLKIKDVQSLLLKFRIIIFYKKSGWFFLCCSYTFLFQPSIVYGRRLQFRLEISDTVKKFPRLIHVSNSYSLILYYKQDYV